MPTNDDLLKRIQTLEKSLSIQESKGIQIDMSARDRSNLCALVSQCGGGNYVGFIVGSTGLPSPGFPFPSGWTSVRNSPGTYTVTHNLNIPTTSYAVLLTSNQSNRLVSITSTTTTTFTVDTTDLAGTLSDSQFWFGLFTV